MARTKTVLARRQPLLRVKARARVLGPSPGSPPRAERERRKTQKTFPAPMFPTAEPTPAEPTPANHQCVGTIPANVELRQAQKFDSQGRARFNLKATTHIGKYTPFAYCYSESPGIEKCSAVCCWYCRPNAWGELDREAYQTSL